MKAASDTARSGVLWVGVALLAAALWLWISWCRAPASSWNDLRLAPVFMAVHGEPVYSLPGAGVLNTWMYGPVPLWLWSPAALARDAITAVLAAGALNAALSLGAIIATCLLWPAARATRAERWLAVALTCLVWPEPAFRFLQVDNLVVALGLLANLVLARTAGADRLRWLAALATAGALGCKPTAVALLLGQLVWLGRAESGRAAGQHLGRTLASGAVLALAATAQFGARELWFGAVTIPARLPWADTPGDRLVSLAPFLLAQWAVPLAVLSIAGRRWCATSPALRLPIAVWVGTLPFGLAGILTTGGTTNNLHGFQLLAPALLVVALGSAGRASARLPAVAAAVAVALFLARVASSDHVPLRPATARLRAADALVRAAPREVWLPWAPLVGYFATGRFDHAEDGIYVRFITGHPVSLTQARAHLPPEFSTLVLPAGGGDWGVARKLAPEASTIDETGGWQVLRWAKPDRVDNRTSAPPSIHP